MTGVAHRAFAVAMMQCDSLILSEKTIRPIPKSDEEKAENVKRTALVSVDDVDDLQEIARQGAESAHKRLEALELEAIALAQLCHKPVEILKSMSAAESAAAIGEWINQVKDHPVIGKYIEIGKLKR